MGGRREQAGGSPAVPVVSEVLLLPSMSLQRTASSVTPKSLCSTTRCRTTARGSPSSLFLECFSQLPQVHLSFVLLLFSSTVTSWRRAEAKGVPLGCKVNGTILSCSRLVWLIQHVHAFLHHLKFCTCLSCSLECALLSLCGEKLLVNYTG